MSTPYGRVASVALASTLLSAAVLAQPNGDEREPDARGSRSVEELRQEPVTFDLDLPYADTGNPRHRLDLYLPKDRKREKLPVVVFLHGGAWLEGDKSVGAGPLMPLVRTGQYAGVSAEYRLSGEARWPAQIHDCKAAIRWVRANAARYGLDADRIGVWGESAGGHLALMLGVSGDVPELEGDIGPNRGVSSRVAAVANFFGVSDLLAEIGQPSDIDRTRADAPELGQIHGFYSTGELRFIWSRGFGQNQLCGCGKPFRECEFWTEVVKEALGGFEDINYARIEEIREPVERLVSKR